MSHLSTCSRCHLGVICQNNIRFQQKQPVAVLYQPIFFKTQKIKTDSAKTQMVASTFSKIFIREKKNNTVTELKFKCFYENLPIENTIIYQAPGDLWIEIFQKCSD